MSASLRRLIPFLRNSRGAYIRGVAAALATAIFALAAPRVLQHAIDHLSGGVTPGRLAVYSGLLLGLAIAGGWFRFMMRRLIIGASRAFEYEVRNDYFGHLQRLPASFFDRAKTGDLMSRAVSDLEAVRLMVGIAVIDAVNTAVVFVVAVALMLSLDPVLTAVALAVLPFASLAVRLFGAAIHRRFQLAQVQLARVTMLTQESLAACRVVKAYRQERAEGERFKDETRAYLYRNRSVIRLQATFYGVMVLLLGVGSVLVLWLGARHVIGGLLTIGEFVSFMAYQLMLNLPMVAFGSVTNTVQRGLASWRRILEVMDEPEVRSAKRASVKAPALRGRIEIRNLTFGFGSRRVLDGVSLEVLPGQVAGLAGATGSGKSTLLKLLPRIYDPPRGTVFVDGYDILDLPLDVLRSAIGFVPQEPYLFSRSLADNIAFAPEGTARDREREVLAGGVDLRGAGAAHTTPALMEAIRKAAAAANLDRDVAELPRGYETQLGERGSGLSGGQRQRTALARALMRAPRLLLLDAALSAVDSRTEEEILARLFGPESRSRTTVLVSNRLATLKRVGLIFVLHRGRIVERGTHERLLEEDGIYASLYRKQVAVEELAAS